MLNPILKNLSHSTLNAAIFIFGICRILVIVQFIGVAVYIYNYMENLPIFVPVLQIIAGFLGGIFFHWIYQSAVAERKNRNGRT